MSLVVYSTENRCNTKSSGMGFLTKPLRILLLSFHTKSGAMGFLTKPLRILLLTLEWMNFDFEDHIRWNGFSDQTPTNLTFEFS